jgi:hypothetical protein
MKGWKGVERRKFLRLESPLAACFSLFHVFGRREASRRLEGMVSNVSPGGVCLETNVVLVDGSHVFSEAMTDEKRLKLEITLPGESGEIKAVGKVVWYDLSSPDSPYRFRAGIYLTEMDDSTKLTWDQFLTGLRR